MCERVGTRCVRGWVPGVCERVGTRCVRGWVPGVCEDGYQVCARVVMDILSWMVYDIRGVARRKTRGFPKAMIMGTWCTKVVVDTLYYHSLYICSMWYEQARND